MDINGPSLRSVTPLPADTTPQKLAQGDGIAAPLTLDNPVLGELAALKNRQDAVQTALEDMGAMRANLFGALEMLAAQQGLPPQKRDAIKDRMDQQLTLVFEQTARRLERMSSQQDLNKQDMSAAIAQFVNAVSSMAGNLDAMRSGRSSGKIA